MATDLVTVSPTINGDSVSLTVGMIVRLKPGANNNVVRAQADSSPHVQGVNGVVVSGSFAPGTSLLVGSVGRQVVQMESGLTPAVGDIVFVSAITPGKGTNVLPALATAIGTIVDVTNYARLNIVTVDVNVHAMSTAIGGNSSAAWTTGTINFLNTGITNG